MGYQAGTLDISIMGDSASAIASISETVKALSSLSNAITKLQNVNATSALSNLKTLLSGLGTATKGIDVSALKAVASSARGLSALGSLKSIEKIDWDKAANGFNQLSVAIQPFLDKIKEAESSLTALNGVMSKASSKKALTNLGGGGGGFGSSLKSIFNLGKLTAVFYTAKRIGNVIGDIVSAGADFSETLNLWQVSMGKDFINNATKFVDKLHEAYGISKQTLMNSQAIFKNMLGSLGNIDESTAYAISETVTQMALDYASLYNVTFEESMNKFQAALAGQVRPIRSTSGYDITEQTLYQFYQQLGGEKSMRQLNRTEKQLLAILAIFQQMGRSGAVGDLKNTLNSFANQSRVMTDSWKDIKTYSGIVIKNILQSKNVLVTINKYLTIASILLEALADASETETSTTAKDTSFWDNLIGDPAEYQKEVEDLNNTLLDFDKFRALETPSGSASGGDSMGIDQSILDAAKQYESIVAEAKLEARKLAEEWLKAKGLMDENGNLTVDMEKTFENVENSVGNIGTGLGIISAILGGKKLAPLLEKIPAVSKLIEKLGGTAGKTSLLSSLLGLVQAHPIISLIVVAITALLTSSEDLRKSLGNTLAILGSYFQWIFDIAGSLLGMAGSLSGAFGGLGRILSYVVDFINLILVLLSALAGIILGIVETILKVLRLIPAALDSLFNWDWEGLSNWKDSWKKDNWATKTYYDSLSSLISSGALAFNKSDLKDSEISSTDAAAIDIAESSMIISPISDTTTYGSVSSTSDVYSGTTAALQDWWATARNDIPQFQEASETGLYQAVTKTANSYGKTWQTTR